MAKIFRTVSTRDDAAAAGTPPITFAPNDMETFVTNYWGDANLERTFPIAFWKFKRLLAASYRGEVALRITDIDNSMEVDARWVVFDDALEAAVQDPIEEDICYYVFNENYFYGPVILDTEPPRSLYGMNKVVKNNNPYKTVVVGRIGKDEVDNHLVFFHAAQFELLDGGGGNGGGAAGFKIPAS